MSCIRRSSSNRGNGSGCICRYVRKPMLLLLSLPEGSLSVDRRGGGEEEVDHGALRESYLVEME